MKKEMLINVLQPEECRIAIVADGILEELYVERTSHESYVGNIYKGRIVNIEPSIQAAFVDFGVGRNGFLHISDVEPQYFRQGGYDPTKPIEGNGSQRGRGNGNGNGDDEHHDEHDDEHRVQDSPRHRKRGFRPGARPRVRGSRFEGRFCIIVRGGWWCGARRSTVSGFPPWSARPSQRG